MNLEQQPKHVVGANKNLDTKKQFLKLNAAIHYHGRTE